MRVIHAGLVVGDGDKGCGRASVLNELIQHFFVVHGELVHVLWEEKSGSSSCSSPPAAKETLSHPQYPNQNQTLARLGACDRLSLGLWPLTGPEAAVGAHQAHDDTAGYGPGEPGHRGERPLHVEGHLLRSRPCCPELLLPRASPCPPPLRREISDTLAGD